MLIVSGQLTIQDFAFPHYLTNSFGLRCDPDPNTLYFFGQPRLTLKKLNSEVKEIGSGVKHRQQREELLKAARRREVEVVIVWRLDRWGRSLADPVVTLRVFTELGIGFISLN